MGWKTTAFLFLLVLWALSAGALIIGIPLLLYLIYRFLSGRDQRPKVGGPSGGQGRPWMAVLGFLFLFLSLVAAQNQGRLSPIVFGGLGIALLGGVLFPGFASDMLADSAGATSSMLRRLLGKPPQPSGASASIELTQLPLDYVGKSDPKERLLRFQRLAQTLAEFGTPRGVPARLLSRYR
jgi:hypothetical protein